MKQQAYDQGKSNDELLIEVLSVDKDQSTPVRHNSITSYQITGIGDIQNGLVVIFTNSGIGYADLSGNVAIRPHYSLNIPDNMNIMSDGAYYFDGSHVMVSDGESKFIIDTNENKTNFPTKFEKWGYPHNGIV